MLRVGLTGEMGSGKSTVARRLAAHGAFVLSSDEIGRALMQPGTPVYQAIVQHFGPSVLQPDGALDRPALSRLAFDPQNPRVEELNAIIHPAVLAVQEQRLREIEAQHPDAIAVIESALIFSTQHAGGPEPWRKRFDRIVLVTAPEELEVQRYLQRVAAGSPQSPEQQQALRNEAKRRLAAQRIAPELAAACLPLQNDGSLATLEAQVETLWHTLQAINAAADR